MKLYLLRHGLAADREEWSGDDVDRPLTGEGRARMAREAATLARLGLGLDLILTSPLVRAYQTAESVALRLGMMDKLITDERLAPGFGADQLAPLVREHSNAAALMLVGHEPDFSELIGALIGGGRVECKKGSLACVNLPDPLRLTGELIWLLPPKILDL